MLIDSPRLTATDRAEWAEREQIDHLHGAYLDHLTHRAQTAIATWAAERADPTAPVDVSCSWGKDSVVVAHLALTSAVADQVRIVWVRQRWHENPDTPPVQRAFASMFPTAAIEVRDVTTAHPRWWDLDSDWDGAHPVKQSTRPGHRQVRLPPAARPAGAGRTVWPHIRVTGIRAAESGVRDLSAAVHGVVTAATCRPILRWTTAEVFAYLAANGLPTHPAYAMTSKGGQDRDQIRVHSLGGYAGGPPRWQWETAYYGPDIRAGRAEVLVMRALGHSKQTRTDTPIMLRRIGRATRGLITDAEVMAAAHRLHERGLIARWERYGREGWWRWPHLTTPLPGTAMCGDLINE